MVEGQVREHPNCFGCGDSNPSGLGLDLRLENGFLVTEFTPKEEHQGWPDIVHGGIITALLYEVLENFPYYNGIVTMMRSMETRFRQPAATGKPVIAKSWLMVRSGREIEVSASLTGEQGRLIAEGKATLVELTQDQANKIGIS